MQGDVTTVLGSPVADGKPRDGTDAGAVLSSGAWSLSCLPDGTAVLADRQSNAFRHVCPSGDGAVDNCSVLAPGPVPPAPPAPPAPAPSPGPGGGGSGKAGVVQRWLRQHWRLASGLSGGLVGLLLAMAAYRCLDAAGSQLVSRAVARMRAASRGPGGVPDGLLAGVYTVSQVGVCWCLRSLLPPCVDDLSTANICCACTRMPPVLPLRSCTGPAQAKPRRHSPTPRARRSDGQHAA
jgi:hypothetical protein